MKLPEMLLRPERKERYRAMPGDIAIVDLEKEDQSQHSPTDMESETEAPDICDAAFNLTTAGIRALNVLKSLQDKTRRGVIAFLATEEKHVKLIGEHMHMSQPSVSHHLALLFSEGLLNKRRDGKHNFYGISKECKDAIRSLLSSFAKFHESAEIEQEKKPENEEDFACLLKLLSDPMRLKIVHILQSNGETNVNELCTILSVSQPGVSHHLALMREPGFLLSRQDGKHHYYSIPSKGRTMLLHASQKLSGLIDGRTQKS